MVHDVLRRIGRVVRRVTGAPDRSSPLARLTEKEREAISRIRARRLTFLSDAKLASLAETMRSVEEKGLPGSLIEAGCALGGSSILIALLKRTERPLFVYDTFGMMPRPTADDTPEVHERYKTIVAGEARGIGGDTYYGYIENLADVVRSNFVSLGVNCEAHRVSLVKGLVEDTLVLEGAVAFAHIDVDWYAPVRICLERIYPRLVEGGSLILDDYHSWGGCRKAVDEYFGGTGLPVTMDDTARSLKVTKLAA